MDLSINQLLTARQAIGFAIKSAKTEEETAEFALLKRDIDEMLIRQGALKKKQEGNIIWKRTGSFLDQVRDVWKCYQNEKLVATFSVNTTNYCSIEILGETHTMLHGTQNAKKYIESVLKQIYKQ